MRTSEWAVYGPIDMFPFLGARQGKTAVLDVIRQLADNFQVRRFDRERVMLGVDSAASMLRYSLTALDSDKLISAAGWRSSPSSGRAGSSTCVC